MKVYRVENSCGVGPYTSIWKCIYKDKIIQRSNLCCDHNDDNHPAPWEDGIKSYFKYVFAFSSINKVREWFSPYWVEVLCEAGFVLSVYEVSKDFVKKGKTKKQICFIKDESFLIKKILLSEI